jgi:dolichol-phosphate mannosyltransferase
MTKLSIVVGGRNDGYGDDKLTPYGIVAPDTFMLRMCRTIKHNLNMLSKYGIDASYTVVDWSPLDKLIMDDDEFKKIHKEYPVHCIVVDDDLITERGYQSKAFHEYYAKNVGIRHASAEYLLVTNPDDLLTEKLSQNIADVISQEFRGFYWRCHSRFDVNQKLEILAEGLSFPSPDMYEDPLVKLECELGCAAAGDFLLATKEDIIEFGKGYDEENPDHRKPSQKYSAVGSYGGSHCGMDSEILTNLFFNGIKPIKMEGSIMHLDHAKPAREGRLLRTRYNNTENWGFSELYPREISSRFYKLSKKKKIGIVTPIANESDTIEELLDRVEMIRQKIPHDIESYFIFDKISKDDTRQKIEKRNSKKIQCLFHEKSDGLVSCYVFGYKFAIDNGCDIVVEMDAGLSHDPLLLDKFINSLDSEFDACLGTRFSRSGTYEASFHRRFVSFFGGKLINLLMGTRFEDATSGYQAFSTSILRHIDFDNIHAVGGMFQPEIKVRAIGYNPKKVKYTQVPINYIQSASSFKIKWVILGLKSLYRLFKEIRLASNYR